MLINKNFIWVSCNDGHSQMFTGMIVDDLPIEFFIGYNGKIHFEFETEASK